MQPTQSTRPVHATDHGHHRGAGIHVRAATTEDRAAMRAVLRAAYTPYARTLGPELFDRYLADLLDLEAHAAHGRLLVAEVDGRIVGTAAFYPDTSVQQFGWPRGWAGGRALSVHPDARGRGVAQALLAHCEALAVMAGARVFAFHTADFMVDAVALYEHLGYRRAPDFDTDLAAHYGVRTDRPVLLIAYRRELSALRYNAPRRTVRGSGAVPAYYYGRPAWLLRERFGRRHDSQDLPGGEPAAAEAQTD
jgi:GNAT superfamily N-acetyltransferase